MSRPKHSDSGRAHREQVDLRKDNRTRFQTDQHYRNKVITQINDILGFSFSDPDLDRQPLDETYFGFRDRNHGSLSHMRLAGSMPSPRSMETILYLLRHDGDISDAEENVAMNGYRSAHTEYMRFHGLVLDGEYEAIFDDALHSNYDGPDDGEEMDEHEFNSRRSAHANTRRDSVNSDRSESGSTRSFHGYSRSASVYSNRSTNSSTRGSPHRHSRRASWRSDETFAESRPGSPSSVRDYSERSSRALSPYRSDDDSGRASRRLSPARNHPQGSTPSTSHRGRSRTREESRPTSSKSVRKSPSVEDAESTIKMLQGRIRDSKSKALGKPSGRYPGSD